MKNLVLACVVALALCPMVAVADIAISTQAGWFGQAAADREMQEIADNVTGATVEQFTADQQDALADWVVAHTGDGVSDILILCGNFPDTIYAPGNAEPDGSLAELFLDDGNTIINTGDYMFYVNSGGTNNNADAGLWNMMDVEGIGMWGDNTAMAVTAEGYAVAPSLGDLQSDRPFPIDQLEGDWVPELILAQNEDGTRADPIIVVNTVTGGRLGIFYQTASQDNDPRGEVISEWINNYVLNDNTVPNGPARAPDPADGERNLIMPLFSWTAGYGAEVHDVYLGETVDLGAADFKGRQQAAMYFHAFPLLEPGKTYYWRVDEVDAAGDITTGPTWSFRVMPVVATEPNPADGATNVPTAFEASWVAGQAAQTHDFYAGTDPEALDLLGTVDTPSIAVEGLDPDTTYYWRVDENDAAGVTHVGDVWSVSTVPTIEPVGDPNLVGWWTFDTETATSVTALDMSGNGHHGLLVGAINFAADADMGQVLDLPGGDNQFVNIGAVGIDGNDPTTIGCWAKADNTSIPDWTLIFGFTGNADGAGGNGSHFNIGSLGGPGGVGAHCWGWEETIFSDQEALEWHHYAMTYDGTTIAYYGDAMPVDTDPAKSNVQDLAARGDRVHIGSRVTQGSSFPGLVDDCRIYNYALTADEIRQTFLNPLQAYGAAPTNGAVNQLSSLVVLSWNAGDGAVEHDVYLGTDKAAVAAADASDTEGTYRGRQAEMAYAPEILTSNATYYWRVDEVDADGNVVVGQVWSFTTYPVGIPAAANLGACSCDVPGFVVTSRKAQTQIGSFAAMNELIDTGLLGGLPPMEGSEATRVDEFVNMRDTGNGAFSEANGYPDASFPGVDALEVPALDPADGDDDEDFATEILGCIHLTAGMHTIGANSDDGTMVWIGGVEIGRTIELKGPSNEDFTFDVKIDGYYSLRARHLERGGGASLELHEILADGTRLLLNDVANGGSPVFACDDWCYVYDGEALDEAWDHDNGSDAHDDSAIGQGMPGGASVLVEDDVTFLRIQDTGDPRDYGMSDPTNRKVYLTRQLGDNGGLDGAHLEFRIRVATGAPLDDQHPDGGAGIAPWPEGGIGYHIRDGGKGMVGLSEGGGTDSPMQISFSLAQAGEPGFEDMPVDLLVMNSLGGTEANEDNVDSGEGVENILPIADATAWNTVVVDIAAGGTGTHVVAVSVNGEPAVSYDVTAGSRCDEDGDYLAIGSSGTGALTAFDVDYVTVCK